MITKNVDAERQVIGNVIFEKGPLPDLSVEDFTETSHKEIWKCFQAGIFTPTEIMAKAKGPQIASYLAQLIESYLPISQIDRYVKAVQEASSRRKLWTSSREIQDKLEAGADLDQIQQLQVKQMEGIKKLSGLTDLIRAWIGSVRGEFNSDQLKREFDIRTRAEKQYLSKVLSRMIESHEIERSRSKAGWFRVIDNSVVPIDFEDVEERVLDLSLPMGLSHIYKCRPKHIIVVAGEFNSGKTGFLLNTVLLNMDKDQWRDNIHYYNSEMGGGELKNRLREFGRNINTWNASFYERSDNFADVIKPDALNLIDFLELDGSEGREFWRAGAMITAIHDRLNDGVAVIAIQKNRGNPFGLGGQRGLEKPRLYVTLSGLQEQTMMDGTYKVHTATIEKVKESYLDRNMNGYTLHYTIGGGAIIKEHRHFENAKHWHEPEPEEQKEWRE